MSFEVQLCWHLLRPGAMAHLGCAADCLNRCACGWCPFSWCAFGWCAFGCGPFHRGTCAFLGCRRCCLFFVIDLPALPLRGRYAFACICAEWPAVWLLLSAAVTYLLQGAQLLTECADFGLQPMNGSG